MNLAYFYPIAFWNCACLITDSGGDNAEEEETSADDKKKTNNYDKIAIAIGRNKQNGIQVEPPNINKSQYTFYPDIKNNRIIFGLRGMIGVGDEIIQKIIINRPYASPKDFIQKVNPNKTAMISLIKSGAFDEMMDRKILMGWYLWQVCDKKNKLTLQNLPGLIRYNLLSQETEEQKRAYRIYEFTRYLKAVSKQKKSKYYSLDERALNFLKEMELEDLIEADGLDLYIIPSVWEKEYQKHMDIFRKWLGENKEKLLEDLNTTIFKEQWDKYAKGSLSTWEMESLCYYYHEHELAKVNNDKYGLKPFLSLSQEPEIEHTYYRGGRLCKILKLNRICGTCIGKIKTKGIVYLLTIDGVVTVKFPKDYFNIFDRQISMLQPDGTKKVIEKSWFNRGSMIVVNGFRNGDSFVSKKYANGGLHQLYKITEVLPNGELLLQAERYKGGIEEDDEQI